MKRALFASLLAALPCVSAPVAPWLRTPQLAVPKLANAPVIDGTVDRGEWLAASDLGLLKVGTSGAADELRRQVLAGFDDARFYLAFRLERPPGAREPRTPGNPGRVDSTRTGDCVEVMFAPDLDFDHGYAFWLFANGAFGEATTSRGKDKNWNVDWEHAARVTEVGWEGEMAIPFSVFGRDAPPAADEEWGFDLVDNRQTPFKLLGHWSYRGQVWHTYENFGRLRFAEDIPAVRLDHAGQAGDGQIAVAFSIVNPRRHAAAIATSVRLLRRKPGPDGGPTSYYANIESGLSHDAQAEFTKDTTLDDMVQFALGFYETVETRAPPDTIDVPAGQRRTVGFAHGAGAGEYLLPYEFRCGDRTLSAAACPFVVAPPLALQVEPYWLYSQVLDIRADLTKIDLTKTGEARFWLSPPNDSANALASAAAAVSPGDREAVGTVSTNTVEPGFYRVHVAVSAEGVEIARNSIDVEKPRTPPWFRNDCGNRIDVPDPWTPVGADAQGHVDVWGREHDLASLLPKTIRTNGRDLLARPVSLDLTAAGERVPWSVPTFALVETTPGKATYRGTLDSRVATVRGTVEIEFDGFAWYDLELTPKSASLDVARLDLAIDINPELGELQCRHKYLVDAHLDRRPPKPDLNGASGGLVHSKTPFTPYTWIGSEEGGIGFIAEAPIDWHVTRPNSVIETFPATGGAPPGMRIHMIDSPTTLTQPMRLQFGLQATPIRPLPRDRNILNIFQKTGVVESEGMFGEVSEFGGKVFVFYYNWRGNSKTEMGGTPERPRDPGQREKLKRGIALAHKHGLKVLLFTGWGVNATSDNWKKFGYELGRYPIQNKGWGTFAQSAGLNGGYADFMAWGHADIAREYGADGVLWDSTANLLPDRNLRIGNAWTDRDGNVRPKYGVRATRDVYRRIYNIYKGEVRKDGVIYNHGGSMWCINTFADMLNRGEGRPMKAKSLRDCWVPFEQFRTSYSGEPFGVFHSGEINDFKRLPMRVSNHLAVYLLHATYPKDYSTYCALPKCRTYEYGKRPTMHLWKVFDWLPFDESVRRFQYYHDEKAITQTPDALLSSAFVSGDRRRAIVVVSNLDKEPVTTARVTINRARMGLLDGELRVEDAYLRTAIELAGDGFEIDILPESYRILKLWVE